MECISKFRIVFNVCLATQWANDADLGNTRTGDPENIGLALLIIEQVARSSFCHDIPSGIGFTLNMENIACMINFTCIISVPLVCMAVFDQQLSSSRNSSVSIPELLRLHLNGLVYFKHHESKIFMI